MMIHRPRVVNGSEVGDGRRSAERELVEIQLAQHNRAGSLQSRDDVRIVVGNPVLEERARTRGPDPSRVDVVFERDWNAVQWAATHAAFELGVHLARSGQSLFARDGDEGVDRLVVPIDACETGLCQFNR